MGDYDLKEFRGVTRLFPLGGVVLFPHAVLPLHIFEPRYLQLISECETTQEPFGIPFYDSGLQKFGTLLELTKIKKRYPEGKMDITAIGIEPFEILTFNTLTEGKLYPGGIIKTIPISFNYDEKEAILLQVLIEKFFKLLGEKSTKVAKVLVDILAF